MATERNRAVTQLIYTLLYSLQQKMEIYCHLMRRRGWSSGGRKHIIVSNFMNNNITVSVLSLWPRNIP